ncbi:MAG: trypsin-like serine protease, partial [Polyangiaceae bacterium]
MHGIGLSIASLALVVSVVGCSASPATSDGVATNQIQGGDSDSGDPAVGLIEFTNNTFCTGSLITPDIILTAGHCTLATPSAFYIGINKSSATRYSIANVAPFPGYHATNTCPNPTIDVALMQLSAPVDGV